MHTDTADDDVSEDYPRVLLVHMTRVYQEDAVNLLLRTLFGEWPRENLAQIYTGSYRGVGTFCGRYYEIGPRDRFMGSAFYRLKPTAMNVTATHQPGSRGTSSGVIRHLAAGVVGRIVRTGLWDALFRIKFSAALRDFVSDFAPDIVYTQGYNLSLTQLSLAIADQRHSPLCYFPMDDWDSALYAGSPVHAAVRRTANAIARRASVRLALGPKMAEALTARYGVPFRCLYHADDMARFPRPDAPGDPKSPLVIGYTGSLYLGRTAALLELLEACRLLQRPFLIRVYCPDVPVDMPADLEDSPHIQMLPLPGHSQLPHVLAECDALFLPESFSAEHRKAIELSLSTKAHLYMMSGKPIVVYAPPYSGITDYARRYGWGVVVDRRGEQYLLEGIRQATGLARASWVSRADQVARINHDLATLRAQVHQDIRAAIASARAEPSGP
jgi:hypothetical protein